MTKLPVNLGGLHCEKLAFGIFRVCRAAGHCAAGMAKRRRGRRCYTNPVGSPAPARADRGTRANGGMVAGNTGVGGFANTHAHIDPGINGGETVTAIPDEQAALVEAAKTLLRHAVEGDKPTLVVVVDEDRQVVDLDIRPFADVAALLRLVQPQPTEAD